MVHARLCRDGLAPRCERLSTSDKLAVCAENCKNTLGSKWVKFDKLVSLIREQLVGGSGLVSEQHHSGAAFAREQILSGSKLVSLVFR